MKKNFKRKLSLVCAKVADKENFHYLYFRNGFVYVSNCFILVRQSLSAHGFEAEEIALLDGVCMHKEVFDVIWGYEYINVVKEGEQVLFVCIKGKVTAKYGVHSVEKEGITEPNFETVLPQVKLKLAEKSVLGVNLDLLVILKSLILGEHKEGSLVNFYITDDSKSPMNMRAIVVKSFGCKLEDEFIIVMPSASNTHLLQNDEDIDWSIGTEEVISD